jgi:PAS domain S-box-containing protein
VTTTPQPDFLAALAAHSLVGFYLIQDEHFRYVNPAFARIFGYESDALVGRMGPQDLILPEDQPLIEESRRLLLQREVASLHYEVRARTLTQATIEVEVLVVMAPFDGRPAVIGTVLDITERKRAEREASGRREEIEALYRASSRLLRTTDFGSLARESLAAAEEELGHGDAAIFVVEDGALRRVACSAAAASGPAVLPLSGPGITVLAANTGEIVSVADVTAHPRYVRGGGSPGSELAIPLKVGERVLGVLDVESTRTSAFTGRDVLVLKAFADRTALAIEQAQLHQRLRDRTRQLERFHELALMMVGNPTEVYEAISRQIAELLETPFASLVQVEGDLIRSLAIVSSRYDLPGETFPIRLTPCQVVLDTRESRIFHDIPERFPLDPYLTARGIRTYLAVPVFDRKGDVVGVLNAMDTRERNFGEEELRILRLLARRAGEEMEEERRRKESRATTQLLLHSEKMASLGQVVAGVAHELNNPLASVLGTAELLSRRTDLPEAVMASVARIASEADRARRVVRNLLAFARQHEPQRAATRLDEVVAGTLALREHELRLHNIEVVRELAPDLPSTLADAHLLQQAFLNLVLNAEQAMLDTHGRGRLTVRARFLPEGGTARRGPAVRLEFEDDGPGIPEESRAKVFEPFYTTKTVGTGTGLGLSLTHSIVTQHGGAIWVESGDGGGARFVLELPVVAPEVDAQAEPEGSAAGGVLKGRRVLLVEDEEPLRELGREVLEDEGCVVEGVSNGREALRRLLETDFDLVVSDVKMPELSGLELYKLACAERPRLRRRFLFVTGDVVRAETAAFLEETGCTHLDKPYNVAQLIKRVSDVLADANRPE